MSHLSLKAYFLLRKRQNAPSGKACGEPSGYNSIFVFDGAIVETSPVTCPKCLELLKQVKYVPAPS